MPLANFGSDGGHLIANRRFTRNQGTPSAPAPVDPLAPPTNTPWNAQQSVQALQNYHDQTPINVAGVGGVTYNGNTPNITLDPRTQQQLGLFGNLGVTNLNSAAASQPGVANAGQALTQTGTNFLSQAGAFDPLASAQGRYEALQSVLQPDQARTRASLEARLLAQGRLDSSGGGLALQANDLATQQQNAQLLDQMYSEAQQQQAQGLQTGQSLIGSGAGVQSGLFNQATTSLNAPAAALTPALQLLQSSQDVRNNELARLNNAASNNVSLQTGLAKANAAKPDSSSSSGWLDTALTVGHLFGF